MVIVEFFLTCRHLAQIQERHQPAKPPQLAKAMANLGTHVYSLPDVRYMAVTADPFRVGELYNIVCWNGRRPGDGLPNPCYDATLQFFRDHVSLWQPYVDGGTQTDLQHRATGYDTWDGRLVQADWPGNRGYSIYCKLCNSTVAEWHVFPRGQTREPTLTIWSLPREPKGQGRAGHRRWHWWEQPRDGDRAQQGGKGKRTRAIEDGEEGRGGGTASGGDAAARPTGDVDMAAPGADGGVARDALAIADGSTDTTRVAPGDTGAAPPMATESTPPPQGVDSSTRVPEDPLAGQPIEYC